VKQADKRRSLEDLMNYGRFHASISHALKQTLNDAIADESELAPIYSRLLALHAYAFVEMAEVWTRVPTLVGGMDEWGKMVREEIGTSWSESEKTRFAWLISEYAKAVDAAGGIEPVGLASQGENADFTIMFDSRDRSDEEHDDDDGDESPQQ
jgi:hypothetical protein